MADLFYYAYASRHVISEQTYEHGVEFEIVSKSKIIDHVNIMKNILLNKEKSQKHSALFWEHFLNNEDLDILYMSIYMGYPYSESFAETRWFMIEISDAASESNVYHCIIEPLSPFPKWSEKTFCKIKTLSKKGETSAEEEALNNLFSMPADKLKEAADKQVFGNIGPATVIGTIRAYYVGAALCIGLIDAGGVFQGFFDLGIYGIPAGFVSHTAAGANYLEIMGQLTGANPLTIIISHWHNDHINIINDLTPPQVNTHTWIYPESNSPVAAGFSNHLQNAGVAHLIMQNVQANLPHVTNHIINNNFSVHKMDYIANDHPHHHGIYVRIVSQLVNTILLSGDCTYAGMHADVLNIPPPAANSAILLQASHHGGD